LESQGPAVENAEEAYDIVKSFFADQRLGAMLKLSQEAFIQNYDSSALVQEVVGEVADVQKGIDLAQEPQHRIESLLGRLYGGRKKVELRGREVVVLVGRESIPLESLSSGEKQLLQLLLEFLAAGQNPVLIDEPELSLHVDWQNELVSCMRTVNEKAQLIMATHSPEVMANLRDQDIYEL
jgi:predicted ATPase